MRFGALLAAVVLGVGVAACGGDPAAPLTLEQRVPGASEAPGSEADPVETRVTVTGIDEFSDFVTDDPRVTDEDIHAFENAGFVAAVRDARFFPNEPGGEHVPEARHLFALVLQFDSDDGARDAAEQMHQFNLRPCPDTCAFDVREFDVDGTSNATGVQRIATQESLDEVGDPGHPRAEYIVNFADGPYVYDIALDGPPGEVSEQEVEEIARKLYERVAGAPPPESD